MSQYRNHHRYICRNHPEGASSDACVVFPANAGAASILHAAYFDVRGCFHHAESYQGVKHAQIQISLDHKRHVESPLQMNVLCEEI